MIFLTVGTWRVGYDRLVKAVDELVGGSVINEEVITQVGNGKYVPKHMKIMDFCSPNEFNDLISKARLVISHAGMGTIIETVIQRKPIIVVPRCAELGEVDNDHQFSTAKQLEAEGKILVAYEVSELPAKLEEANVFVPAKSESSKGILRAVQNLIEDVVRRKNS